MKILIALCICLSGSLAVVAQTAAHKRVEGRVSVFFGWEGAQLRDSYVLCEGAAMPVKLSPSGYFSLHQLDTGEVKLRLSLWGGTYTHDTTLRLHDALLNFHWEILFDSEVSAIRAQYDQRYARPKLLIVGVIAPAEVVRQETFEQQYDIQYHSYGCGRRSAFCFQPVPAFPERSQREEPKGGAEGQLLACRGRLLATSCFKLVLK